MDLALIVAIEVLYAIASLALISIGLAIIFGMMRVINLAHGEFLMMGGFACTMLANAGVNLWISMLILAPLIVGAIGIIVERLVIRYLYGRLIETILATWGLSLFFIGLASVTVGYFQMGLTPPFGSIRIGVYSEGVYTLVIIGIAIVVMLTVYLFLRHTRWGLIARGTMQYPNMAAALGVNPNRVYAVTFFAGSALSGLAGAVLVPLAGVVPTSGIAYIAKAFITVISGGATVIAGTAAASVLLGGIDQIVSFTSSPVMGEAALLLVAVILLRFLPQGITGRFFRSAL